MARALSMERDDIVALHDRRLPGSRANIDHLVVAPRGVFVIDAKYYRGNVEIRDRGNWRRRDLRLYVGGRDCSELARAMDRQVECVSNVVAKFPGVPAVTPVLCFVDAEWPLFRQADEYAGVRLEGSRSVRKLVSGAGPLDSDEVRVVAAALALALPAA